MSHPVRFVVIQNPDTHEAHFIMLLIFQDIILNLPRFVGPVLQLSYLCL